jgi:hypothetical protein
MPNSGYIVGAYTCAPSIHALDPLAENAFWDALVQEKGVAGIEQPCLQTLHPMGDDYLLDRFPDHWQLVLTAVMGTMQARSKNGAFGLASSDPEGRKQAIALLRTIHDKVHLANDRLGRRVVSALEIHSAPVKGVPSSREAAPFFARSLEEICSWDWECPLLIEHCDSLQGIDPRKGFLELEDELQLAREHGVKLVINWARSVIEGQDVTRPLEHLQRCREAGLLGGLMFSGTAIEGPYGNWGDWHAPFAPFAGSRAALAESLLTVDLAAQSLKAAGPTDVLGFKLMALAPETPLAQRLGIIQDGVAALDLARAQLV